MRGPHFFYGLLQLLVNPTPLFVREEKNDKKHKSWNYLEVILISFENVS